MIAANNVSLDDLFDVSQGAGVTGSTFEKLMSYPPAMFGGTKPNPPSLGMEGAGQGNPESAVTFFEDHKRQGFTHLDQI